VSFSELALGRFRDHTVTSPSGQTKQGKIVVKTTYALTPDDQKKLISYASRYRSIRTRIDETDHTMTVWTTFDNNDEPTSGAETFKLQVVSADAPVMPDDEFRRRRKGEPV
jgi:hypothetical protein